ncbi:uncharacterized protein LOC143560389 [Bidens hawaiensis]|uniref:uncharacterized protein LOC143560389 n=1 Tax=Bidens hawaiensis TaxID=980011 RepID=UPI0040498F8B
MMGNSRVNERGKVPVSDNSSVEANNNRSGLSFFDEANFDSLLDMSLTFEDFHRSLAQGTTEPVANPNSFQNPEMNTGSNTVNTNLQGVSLLPDWNIWDQQSVNQGHNAVSAGWESSFVSLNRPQVNRDITGSSLLTHSTESAPVHTRSNVGFLNQSQSGTQGNFGDGFLSLRVGGTEEFASRSQRGSREISDKRKEAALNELKMARAQKATGQMLGQTLDAGFMGFQSNNSGFSNQFHHERRMTSTNNEVGIHGSMNSWQGSSLQQNGMQHYKNLRSGDLGLFRDEKLKEENSTDIKMVHAREAIGLPSGQLLDTGFVGFQSNTSGLPNQFNNVNQMSSTNNEVGVPGTLNSGIGSSPHHILQMQQNDSRNIRSSDLNQFRRAFIGNQPVCSGTIDGNSAQLFNSQQHNLNKPSEFEKPTRLASSYTPFEQLQHMRSSTANNPNYAGQAISQRVTPSQNIGSNMFYQRTAAPQVSWAEMGPAGIDEPFPKRLGVDFNVRNSLQTNQRRLSSMGSCFQTTSTGRTDGAPVSYSVNSQEPVFAHGQSQNVLTQLAKSPQGAPSASASTVIGQPQKTDLHIRSHHKRSAGPPHPASRWVQRQKTTHPTVPHSMPKQCLPATTAEAHSSVPVGPRSHPVDPIAARVRPVVPCASVVRPPVPVTTAPAVTHITSKGPEATRKLSGHKCYLCKRDLALTSEGPVYQPAVPPPVAVLPCGHTFHDQCLQNITPDDQAKDPPCIPCAIGEK